MQLAKQMMREGAGNVQDVAMRVGYESKPRSVARSNARPAHRRQRGVEVSRVLEAERWNSCRRIGGHAPKSHSYRRPLVAAAGERSGSHSTLPVSSE